MAISMHDILDRLIAEVERAVARGNTEDVTGTAVLDFNMAGVKMQAELSFGVKVVNADQPERVEVIDLLEDAGQHDDEFGDEFDDEFDEEMGY